MLLKEAILKLTNNGEDIFRHYIKHNWRLGINFKNPFYHDTNPSFNIFIDNKSGVYRMKDRGNDLYNGDCFDLVGVLYNLNSKKNSAFQEILHIVNRDLSLGIDESSDSNRTLQITQSMAAFQITPESHNETKQEQKPRPYKATLKPMSDSDMEFWSKYGIDKQVLSRYNVTSITEFSSINKEGKPYRFRATVNEPIFGYKGEDFTKIYRPHSSARFMFGGKTPEIYIFGLRQLPFKGDMVLITGGEKDVLSLAAKGFYAISFNGEKAKVSKEIIESLYHRFKHIVVLYDMDKTGIETSEKIVQEFANYNLIRLELPLSGEKMEKDVSDYFRIGYTRKDLIGLFTPILDDMYKSTMTMLSSCEIDCRQPIVDIEPIISIAGVNIGTAGNLLGITGGEGTGKSCYIAALLSGAIKSHESDIDTLGTTILPNKRNKAVLLYDTEQSTEQLKKNTNSILRRANIEIEESPNEFKSFSLTSLSRKERLNIIAQSMDRYNFEFDGIHLVVIDGVADLIRSANDEAESIAIIEHLYGLAAQYNTCIITVLHYVPNGLKLRGHLGSELQRKAAAILSIEREKSPSISIVKALKVRDGSAVETPILQFTWNKEINMHSFLGVKSEGARVQRKRFDVHKVSQKIFTTNNEYTFRHISDEIQALTSVSERTAADYIKEMVNENIITRNATTKLYKLC